MKKWRLLFIIISSRQLQHIKTFLQFFQKISGDYQIIPVMKRRIKLAALAVNHSQKVYIYNSRLTNLHKSLRITDNVFRLCVPLQVQPGLIE